MACRRRAEKHKRPVNQVSRLLLYDSGGYRSLHVGVRASSMMAAVVSTMWASMPATAAPYGSESARSFLPVGATVAYVCGLRILSKVPSKVTHRVDPYNRVPVYSSKNRNRVVTAIHPLTVTIPNNRRVYMPLSKYQSDPANVKSVNFVTPSPSTFTYTQRFF